MNSRNGVLWLGFTLIILRLFTTNQWKALWGGVTNNTGAGDSISKAFGGGSSGGSTSATPTPGQSIVQGEQSSCPAAVTAAGFKCAGALWQQRKRHPQQQQYSHSQAR